MTAVSFRIAGLGSLVLVMMLAGGCGGGSSTPTTPKPVPECVPASPPEFAYVLNDGANTISMYTVDSCTGSLIPTIPGTVPTGGNNFGSESIAVDPGGRFAYVANLMSNAADLATISMYTINSSTGVLTPTTPPTVATGYFPQGIAIDPSGKFVYTANSDDNTVSMFTITASSGVLTPTTPPAVSTQASVSTGNESSPGAVTIDPSGRFAYAVNQDNDTVSMFTIDSATGVLTPTTPATVFTGGSPFGITLDPSGKFAYVPDAYSQPNNFVSEFTVDSFTGVLTPTAQIAVSAGNSPTSVAVDPTSKFAYVVNRQDNTVSMFTIDPSTGNLTPNTPATVATGEQPFRIVVDPSGKFAYVTNQDSASISIYTLKKDGTLTAAGTTATGSDPVSMAITRAKQ